MRIEIEISKNGETQINDWVLGNMTLMGKNGSHTSKDKAPNQAMMILPSIVELLDGVRKFISDKREKNYEFVGVDSSYCFTLQKHSGSMVRIVANGRILDTTETKTLISAIWTSVDDFLSTYRPNISLDSAILDDLNLAVRDFEQDLSLFL